MSPKNPVLRSHIRSLIMGAIALFLVVSLIMYPEQAFNSSLKGLKIWWDVVFPALLPFFIASEILMGFGVVHFLGILLEPLMRPLFRLPGVGAFVVAMGLASGYPIGAKLTARLREQELISRSEGERLVSFANTADPLFMFGAVAVGFFHDVSLGVIIAITHYVSSLLLGFIMRFHDPGGAATPPPERESNFILIRAFREMHKARMKDGRGFGELMGDATTSSINTLLMVGGFMIMFSVVIEVLNEAGVMVILSAIISGILSMLQFPVELAPAVISGTFEITLGAQVASQVPNSINMAYKIAIVSAVTAWSGLSVHSQVASILSKTDIRYTPYLTARLIHGFLAGWITLLLWNPVSNYIRYSNASIPAFFRELPDTGWHGIAERISFLGWRAILLLGILMMLGLLVRFFNRFRTNSL
ncbi:sporulation integral membrane protein YlbJ [Melghirimyces thermohalophilus]|uniref:Sporulation integral membrane protein YlbJ n=1 Tax=Melghirimyces thermohalophilus TaxID=1236220 RepID=A0A1G6NIF9_9BACL|nr:sporulation integral membrane protein YlbJ [Melghirimyces thermohalophilus]SDC67421.1 sporulation integral membrane protein YlbJ [Melghirimyces thermohalophilus]